MSESASTAEMMAWEKRGMAWWNALSPLARLAAIRVAENKTGLMGLVGAAAAYGVVVEPAPRPATVRCPECDGIGYRAGGRHCSRCDGRARIKVEGVRA